MNPINNRLLVKPDEPEKISKGGLIIPRIKDVEPESGVVIKACQYKTTKKGINIPIDVKAGDRIFFNKYRALPCKNGVEDLLFVNTDDVMAIL